jgi:uncharacterized membrane protein
VKKQEAVHSVFKTITILKGIHAVIEILLGVILLILSKEMISNIIIYFVAGRLAGDPSGFVARHVTQFGIDMYFGMKLFFAVYLGSHGIVNLSLVYGIIKKPFIAYPISIVVFIGFLIYQAYSYFTITSVWLLVITLFDAVFIVLLFYEYNNHLKNHSFLGKLKLIAKAKVPRIVEIKLPKLRISRIIPIRQS